MANLSEFTEKKSVIGITLHKNYLSKNGGMYSTVSRNYVSLENLLSDIIKSNIGEDPNQVRFHAAILQNKILENLKAGNSVDVIGLGRFYLSYKMDDPTSKAKAKSGEFSVRFTPSETLNEVIKNLKVDNVVEADSSPYIETIYDPYTDQYDAITPDSTIIITGEKLKVGGAESGIWFAPVTGEDTWDENEENWLKVDEGKIHRNLPKELNFFAPVLLEKSRKYRIIIRTRFLSASKDLKELHETVSQEVTILR